jgi:hypothetical protein
MPDENPTHDSLSLETHERDVLFMLTGDQPLWSPDDLGRALDDRIAALDAIGGLRRGGLAYRTTDGFVFASNAGVRAVAVIGRVV